MKMGEKKISIQQVKAILSMISMALLAIQHHVGVLADNISVSYIPLVVTFVTIFIGAMDMENSRGIKRVSLIATVLVALAGCIIYTIQSYGIKMDDDIYKLYIKGMFLGIATLSLLLSILYIKRICELK